PVDRTRLPSAADDAARRGGAPLAAVAARLVVRRLDAAGDRLPPRRRGDLAGRPRPDREAAEGAATHGRVTMSWLSSLLALAADRPLLARLVVASVELLACSLLLGVLLIVWQPSSRRFTALLWLAVLAKPVLSLAIGAPLAFARFHSAPHAVVA